MSGSPTLAELRQRVFKHSTPGTSEVTGSSTPRPEIGNWLARRWGRPTAVYGTWLAVRLGCSAHQITIAALVSGTAAAVAIGTGTRAGFLGGVLLAHLAYWFDHVDGQVARWRRTSGLTGTYFDYLMHHAHNLILGFALGFGLAVRTGELPWSVAGFVIGSSWLFLGLHNDCRYKAFFQRLKLEGRSYRVDGGAGERPSPPPPWPRRGRGVLTWPAYKSCEPHVVLIVLTILAVPAVAAPTIWEWAWYGFVGLQAGLAPGLVLARTTRAIRRDAITTEFDRWFRPWPEA